MSDPFLQSKAALRQALRAKVRALSAEERDQRSMDARALLRRQAIWREAASILFYAPLPCELSLWPLVAEALSAGKKVLLPRFNPGSASYEACLVRDPERDLQIGKFNIEEPRPTAPIVPLNQLDLVLAPGLGFDPLGGRLGRGRGFYDRLLVQVSGMKCGVAYDEQVMPEIPLESHDIRLNYILTPTRWLMAV